MTLGIPPEVRHCDHSDLAADLRARGTMVDALIVDAPYSERCHAGHDGQTAAVNRETGASLRSSINYAPWTSTDVAAFVQTWAPLVSGWIVSLTDSDLSPVWRAEMDRAGLLAFARVPSIESGATVRFNGDGPANWTVDVMVARTRASHHQGAWHPRSYYLHPRETKAVVGGKPLSLMRALVRDYSRPGDLVADPCCGAGTSLVAAKLEGRRAIGCDRDEKHVDIARRWLAGLPQHSETQRGLFDEVGE